MYDQKPTPQDAMSLQSQAELVKDIKKNVASLKTSIDQILVDMENIRATKLEILEKFGCVKSESIVNSEQLQATLGKAKRVMKKSEENQRKLEIVLKKINNFNIINTISPIPMCENLNEKKKQKRSPININKKDERIKLHLLNNNKYALTDADSATEAKEDAGSEKCRSKESALKELQWIVKLKLYKLRHHYDKLGYDLDLEERTPLPLSRRRS